LCDASCSDPHIASLFNGRFTVQPQSGFASVATSNGLVGGSVLTDPVNFIYEAAVFGRDGSTQLISPQPGEAFASVIGLNSRGDTLVESFDINGVMRALVARGKSEQLIDLGPANPPILFFGDFNGAGNLINEQGVVAGTAGAGIFSGAVGFTYDSVSRAITILPPWPGDPTETLAWAVGINNRGHVVGYSYTLGIQPYHERIGFWTRDATFETSYVETISSGALLSNDRDEIVITLFDVPPYESYLVPRPGVRLDLAPLVHNMPAGQDLRSISSFDNDGDMLGSSSTGNTFLLQRLGSAEMDPGPAQMGPAHDVDPMHARHQLLRPQVQAKP
jgi:hypothetical protein